MVFYMLFFLNKFDVLLYTIVYGDRKLKSCLTWRKPWPFSRCTCPSPSTALLVVQCHCDPGSSCQHRPSTAAQSASPLWHGFAQCSTAPPKTNVPYVLMLEFLQMCGRPWKSSLSARWVICNKETYEENKYSYYRYEYM